MKDQASKIETEIVEISPEVASAWLDQNTHNRRIAPQHVERLARDMQSGRWLYTGDAIKFDRHGTLIDGQHRLAAIVMAGIPVTMHVIYGLPIESQQVIDGGRRRTAADAFSLLGYTACHQLAATARIMIAEGRGLSPTGSHSAATTSEVIACVEVTHPKLPHYILPSGSVPKGVHIGGVSMCNYLAHYALDIPEVGDDFVRIIKHGSDDTKCPARAYRERCINAYADGQPLPRSVSYYTCKKAFGWFLEGTRKQFTVARENVDIPGVDQSFYRDGPGRRKRKATAA